jgi:hypothetical protein
MDLNTLQEIASSNDPPDDGNPVELDPTDHASSQSNEASIFLNRPFTTGLPEEEINFYNVPPMIQPSWDHDDTISVLSTPGLGQALKCRRSSNDDTSAAKRGKWDLSDSSHSTSVSGFTLGTQPLSRHSKRKRSPSVTGQRKKSKSSPSNGSSISSVRSRTSQSSRSPLLFTSSTVSSHDRANLFPNSGLYSRSSLPSRSGFSTRSGQTHPLNGDDSLSSFPSHQTSFSHWTPLSALRPRTTDTITEPGFLSQSSSISSQYDIEPHSNLVRFNDKRKRDTGESFQRRTRQKTLSSSTDSFSLGTFTAQSSRRSRPSRQPNSSPIRTARSITTRRNDLLRAVDTFPTNTALTTWNPRRPTRYDSDPESITEFTPSPPRPPRYQLRLIDTTAEPTFWTDRHRRNEPLRPIPEAPHRQRMHRQPQSRLDDIDPVPQEGIIHLTGKRSRQGYVPSGPAKQQKRPRTTSTTASRRNSQLKPAPLSFTTSKRQHIRPARRSQTRHRPIIPRAKAPTSSDSSTDTRKRNNRSKYPNDYLFMLDKYKYKKEDYDDDERFIL